MPESESGSAGVEADSGPESPADSLVRRARTAVARAVIAATATVRRRDARLVLGGVTVVYLALYLFAVGHLLRGDGSVGVAVVTDPLSRMFQSLGPLSFEPIARIDLGPAALLVAPVNLALGLGLSLLVGLNLAVSYLAWRHPRACGIRYGKGAGALAGLPALLSGAACCGPVVLIALGIQATGLLLATFEVLVPVAAVLLVGSLLYVSRSVDPSLAAAAARTGSSD